MGLYFSKEEKEGSIKLKPRDNGVTFSAKAFLDNYNIPYVETKKYLIDQLEEDGEILYVVDLNDEIKNDIKR